VSIAILTSTFPSSTLATRGETHLHALALLLPHPFQT